MNERVDPELVAHALRRVRDVTAECHDEARRCADAKLFRPACIMAGAALEGVLLHTAMVASLLGRDQAWPKKRPDLLSWTLGDLLDVAFAAGWMPDEFRGQHPPLEDGDLGNAASWLKWLRNLLHPGAFVRELDDGMALGEPAFANAYGVLDAVYDRMADVLNSFSDAEAARTVHTPVTPGETKTAD